jgi:hypothetical protein
MSRLDVIVAIVALGNVAIVLEFVRRRWLREGLALFWIFVGMGGILLGVLRPLIDRLSVSVGVKYGASFIFALAILFLLLVCMYLSVRSSALEQRVEILAEEIALMKLGQRDGGVQVNQRGAPVPDG